MTNGEIISLTGIRGIAALYVVLFHIACDYSNVNFIDNGYISVDLFFILSGFILSYVYQDMFSNGTNLKDYSLYLGNRIARVWPTYIFWTCFAIFYYYRVTFPPLTIISNVFMVQNWGLSKSIVGTGWSLSTEFLVYFVFPFLCSIRKQQRSTIFLLSFSALFLILLAAYYKPHFMVGSQVKNNGLLDIIAFDGMGAICRTLGAFLLGIVAWKLFDNYKSIELRLANFLTALLLTILIFALSMKKLDIIIILTLFVVIPLTGAKNTFLNKLLSSRPFYLLGVISYSLYLSHALFIYKIRIKIHYWLLSYHSLHKIAFEISVFATLLVTIGIACLSYRIIEKPLRNVLRSRLRLRY